MNDTKAAYETAERIRREACDAYDKLEREIERQARIAKQEYLDTRREELNAAMERRTLAHAAADKARTLATLADGLPQPGTKVTRTIEKRDHSYGSWGYKGVQVTEIGVVEIAQFYVRKGRATYSGSFAPGTRYVRLLLKSGLPGQTVVEWSDAWKVVAS